MMSTPYARQWFRPFMGFAVAVLAAVGHAAQPLPAPLQNAGFEATDEKSSSLSIPGWTTYGAPMSSIAVDHRQGEEGVASLRVARGKAFCYGIAIDPATDYVLSLRVRAHDAKSSIEADPPLPGPGPTLDAPPTFDWKTIQFEVPSSRRPPGTREMWIALGGQPNQPGGAVWYDDVKLEPVGGEANLVPNASFEERAIEVEVPPGWALDAGAASLAIDSDSRVEGSQSLKVTGAGRPMRLTQPINLAPFRERGVRRIRISGQGRSQGLGRDRVRLEVYGADPPARPILSLTGDRNWTRGEIVVDISRSPDCRLAIWLNAPRPFEGDAWFDDIRIEAVPDDEVVNLLSNATFQPGDATPSLPDFWGLWGDAVMCVEPWSFDYFGLDDEPGPIPGVGVLRVEYPKAGTFVPVPPSRELSCYVLTGSDLNLLAGPYTFSIYAKAARADTIVQLRHPASNTTAARARVGTTWQRIVATSTTPNLLPAIHLPDPGSVVWLAAPQLEPGNGATPFRPPPGETLEGSGAPGEIIPTRGAARVRGDDEAPLAAPASPLRIFAELDRIQDGDATRARVEWSGPTPATVHWRFLNAATGDKLDLLPQSVVFESKGESTVQIPLDKLPRGTIGIQALAVVDGERAARATDVFTLGHASPHDVQINRFSRSIVVQGKPFLPIFLPISPQSLGDWHLDRLRAAGFNCLAAAPGRLSQGDIIRNGIPPAKAAEIRGQLDRLHKRGMRILWPLPWTFDDWSQTPTLYHGDIRGLASTYQAIIAAFRDHPAIIGWYLMDEPSKRSWEGEYGFAESDLRSLWAAAKAADDTRPAYVNWNHTWATEPYGGLACTDIVGHDNYSISEEPFDLGELVPTVRMINDARARGKPAFAWISGSYDEVRMRPSADAVRVHAWLHLIYGTRGLGYWSKPPLDPGVWNAIRSINQEATALHAHVLGNPDATLVANGRRGPSIHCALWVANNDAYLLCVNTASAEVPLVFGVANECVRRAVSADRLFDDRPVDLESGTITDTIPPHERQVYRFTLGASLK